jgi:aminopeptidase C
MNKGTFIRKGHVNEMMLDLLAKELQMVAMIHGRASGECWLFSHVNVRFQKVVIKLLTGV